MSRLASSLDMTWVENRRQGQGQGQYRGQQSAPGPPRSRFPVSVTGHGVGPGPRQLVTDTDDGVTGNRGIASGQLLSTALGEPEVGEDLVPVRFSADVHASPVVREAGSLLPVVDAVRFTVATEAHENEPVPA
jgi:hypothetical protein